MTLADELKALTTAARGKPVGLPLKLEQELKRAAQGGSTFCMYYDNLESSDLKELERQQLVVQPLGSCGHPGYKISWLM